MKVHIKNFFYILVFNQTLGHIKIKEKCVFFLDSDEYLCYFKNEEQFEGLEYVKKDDASISGKRNYIKFSDIVSFKKEIVNTQNSPFEANVYLKLSNINTNIIKMTFKENADFDKFTSKVSKYIKQE